MQRTPPLTLFPTAPRPRCLGVKIGRALGDPCHKLGNPRMRAQRFGRCIVAGQFGLRQGGVNLIVANLMQKHGRPALAPAQSWNKVMQALLGLGRDRAQAQRTDRQVLHDG